MECNKNNTRRDKFMMTIAHAVDGHLSRCFVWCLLVVLLGGAVSLGATIGQQQQQQAIKTPAGGSAANGPVLLLSQALSQPATPLAAKVPSNREIEKQIVDRILGDGYDKRIRPAGPGPRNTSKGNNDGPTIVTVNTLVRSISKIDDVTMEYSVQLSLRQEWIDDRLAFRKMDQYKNYTNLNSITLTEQERIWKPDLFFRNEKEGHFHKIIMPNVLLRIQGHGQVLYSIRISLVLACPMDLKYYPLDKQNCTIEMASYGYLDEDLKFMWKDNNPVQIARPLNLPRFTLETYDTAYCTSKTTTGAYSCLRIDLIFKREFSYYLIQIYIPCCMLVIVSWVSFWLDPNAIPARVSLGVTTLLTMATQISGINASLPPVSYTKAIDVWTGVCLTFVFGALLEFALVNYASRSDQHKREMLTSALTQTQQMRWREATAAAAAAGVAPPTSPPPDENSPSMLIGKHQQAFFGGPGAGAGGPITGGAHYNHHQHHHPGAATLPCHLLHSQVAGGIGGGGGGGGGGGTEDPFMASTLSRANTINNNNHHHLHNNNNKPTSNNNNHNGNQQSNRETNHNNEPPLDDSTNTHDYYHNYYKPAQQKLLLAAGGQPLNGPLLGAANGLPVKGNGLPTGANEAGHGANQHTNKLSPQINCALQYLRSPREVHLSATPKRKNWCKMWLAKFPTRSKRIDVISRIFFPLKFALFNLVYWTTYLFREEDTTY